MADQSKPKHSWKLKIEYFGEFRGIFDSKFFCALKFIKSKPLMSTKNVLKMQPFLRSLTPECNSQKNHANRFLLFNFGNFDFDFHQLKFAYIHHPGFCISKSEICILRANVRSFAFHISFFGMVWIPVVRRL